MCQLDLLAPIRNRVKIAQKETLNAATATNVAQMQQAIDEIYRGQSRGYRHDYPANWQLLDVDITGMPCGKKAAFACKGYVAKQKNRRGRQMGRVLATLYDEVVVGRRFPGKVQLNVALIPLVEGAQQTLQLKENQRTRTILRVDAGGGTLEQVNWALSRGYQYHDRGGGVETSVKEDKQGLGITKRNKKRFEAQQMLMHLGGWHTTCSCGRGSGWKRWRRR